MSRRSRWEYFRAVYARYRQAERRQKQVILDEFCANTGYHQKYAIRLLNGPPPERARPSLRRRHSPRGADFACGHFASHFYGGFFVVVAKAYGKH